MERHQRVYARLPTKVKLPLIVGINAGKEVVELIKVGDVLASATTTA
jgi:hypothetical protein